MKKLLLILMFATFGMWDATAQEMLQDTVSKRIEGVVVTGRGRSRARKYFRQFVSKVPLQGWYIGYAGAYRIDTDAPFAAWQSQGEYERNHIPGDDANKSRIELFKLRPSVASDSTRSWQIQRHILLASSLAERASTLGYDRDANMSYRGMEDGLHAFAIAESGASDLRGFQTRIFVDDESGLFVRSESVSRSSRGLWNITVDYALFEEFVYPSHVSARFELRDPLSEDVETVNVEMTDIVPRRFMREVTTEKYWQNQNDPRKVLKKKVRDKILRMRP